MRMRPKDACVMCVTWPSAEHATFAGNGTQHNVAIDIGFSQARPQYSPTRLRDEPEMICRAYHPGWLLLDRWHIETGKSESLEKAKNALRRLLEIDATSPEAAEAWLMLAHACYKTEDALGEVHAFIERAQLDATPGCYAIFRCLERSKSAQPAAKRTIFQN